MDLIFAFNTTDENDTPDSTWLLDYSNGDLVPEYVMIEFQQHEHIQQGLLI